MPLLEDLGMAPYVTPDRARREAERQQLGDLLAPLTQPQVGSAGRVVKDEVAAQVKKLLGQQATTNVQTSLIDTIQGSVFGGNQQKSISAPTTSTAPTSGALSSIIGRKNYLTGRGDGGLRSLAQQAAASMGWTGDQWTALDAIINAESSWIPTNKNPSSTAYGLGQFLDQTWKGYGPKTSDPALQLNYMARYIKDRYGDPIKALQFHNNSGYY
jgi:hypothetical protein